jgi:hypothetical protein
MTEQPPQARFTPDCLAMQHLLIEWQRLCRSQQVESMSLLDLLVFCDLQRTANQALLDALAVLMGSAGPWQMGQLQYALDEILGLVFGRFRLVRVTDGILGLYKVEQITAGAVAA